MKRLAIVAVAVFAFAGTLTATAGSKTTPIPYEPAPPPQCTAQTFKPFSADVWSLKQWKRREVPSKTLKAERERLRCAASPSHRKAMKRTWRRDKREFKVYQRQRFQERREQLELTPYAFGEPTIERVAIPPYVVECETQGYYGPSRWLAVNPSSGAKGPYQLLPSTYYEACSSCDWSHLDQHRVASVVWQRSGGSEWACS